MTLIAGREPFHQTRFGGLDAPPSEQGDCWATCVAIMAFGTPDDRTRLNNRIVMATANWWNITIGWVLFHTAGRYTLTGEDPTPLPAHHGLIIASGKSPRFDYEHSVLAYPDGSLAWDPHPSGDGLDGDPTGFISFTQIGDWEGS